MQICCSVPTLLLIVLTFETKVVTTESKPSISARSVSSSALNEASGQEEEVSNIQLTSSRSWEFAALHLEIPGLHGTMSPIRVLLPLVLLTATTT